MIQPKTHCPNCNREITKANLSKHYEACINPDSKLNTVGKFKPLPLRDGNDLNCHFCGKLCKNLNSVKQHECRCKENPNRKAFGQLSNYVKNESIEEREIRCSHSTATLKRKYDEGFISPIKGRKVEFEYLYKESNENEIRKWLIYISDKKVELPNIKKVGHCEGYSVVSKGHIIEGNSVKLTFEHNFIANILLDGTLSKTNTVHHINSIRNDNRIENLMIFETSNDHKRYHNSPYAYLIYNEETHLFKCELRK